ncbi:MAG: hypothetical protein ACRDYD_10505, partial [Acidimicrobiales bacterium]
MGATASPLLAAPALAGPQSSVSSASGPSASGPSASGSQSDPAVAADRAKATRIEAELARENNRINQLAEQYDLDGIRTRSLEAQLGQVHRHIAADRARTAAAEGLVRKVAITAYESGSGALGTLEQLMQVGTPDYGVRLGFLQSAASVQQDAVDRWELDRATLAREQSKLASEDRAARLLARQTHQAAIQASAAAATETSTLAQVQGQIKTLIAQDQARQAAARQAAA